MQVNHVNGNNKPNCAMTNQLPATETAKAIPRPDSTPETPAPAASLFEAITNLATNPDANPDVMEKMLDMQERIMAKQQQQEYNRDFVACQLTMPPVVRDAWNDQTESFYARLDTIQKAIVPHAASHGFGLSFGTADCPVDSHVRVTLDIIHEDGHIEHKFYDSPFDDKGIKGSVNKTVPHSRASAVTYGERYLTGLAFNVVMTFDDDGNGAAPLPIITEEQAAEIYALIHQCAPGTEDKMLEHFKLDSVEEMPEQTFSVIRDLLKRKAEQATAAAEDSK